MISKKFTVTLISLTILAVFAVAPASAASDAFATNITAGDPVYLGESGLDISNILKLGNKPLHGIPRVPVPQPIRPQKQ